MKLKEILKDKKKKTALLSGISFIVLSASLALPSFAWFAKARTTAKLEGLSGAAHGSYFNGGDGSKDKPFEIDNPKQLYYFNWLQDLGYFNTPNEDKTAIKQTYFKLTSDLDMTGVILPPAGTKQYPFVGNFNGAGKTISNLKITNNEESLKGAEPPKGAEYSSGILKQSEIVGFFGVVGCLDDSGKVNSYTYDTSVNQILNMGFDGLDVVSSSSSTLIGLAAGYVNGEIKGVGIKSASLLTKESATPITDVAEVKHISEYSLVGYATENYRSKLDVSDQTISMPQIDNPNTEHGSTNWGGSVNMKQMYTDLKSEQSSLGEDVYFVGSETVDVDIDGNESEPYNITYSSTRAFRAESGGTNYYFVNGKRTDDDGKTLASYGITTSSGYDNNYVFIYGSPKSTPTSSSGSMTVNRKIHGYGTAIGKNGHYLCVSDDGVLVEGNILGSASSWTIPSDGNSGYLSTAKNGVTYYLNLDGNYSLSISTTASTLWSCDETEGNLYTTVNDYLYYVDYDSEWIATQIEPASSYLVIKDVSYDGGMYIGYSGSGTSAIANKTYNNDAYAWGYDSSSNAYYSLNNPSTYLAIKSSNQSVSLCITSSNGSSGGRSKYARMSLTGASDDGTGTELMTASLSNDRRATTYYLYFSNSFNVTSSKASAHTFEISKKYESAESIGLTFQNTEEIIVKETDSVSRNAAYYVNPTYVPLAYSYEDATSKSGINGVSEMNTGYLVGGANFVDSSDYAGDIRISKDYKMSSLSTSFNSTYQSSNLQVLTRAAIKKDDDSYSIQAWSTIKDTYNPSAQKSSKITFSNVIESSSLQRYDSARRNLQQTLFGTYENATASSSDSLYGLHFMDASISTDSLCQVGKAIVYDKEAEAAYQAELKKYLNGEIEEKPTQTGSIYYDYDVPEDSIDFNLATEGYINFFGGSYFTNNKSFFSLNEITRDNNKRITKIREIKQIYANLGDDKDENPYLYSYNGSVPSNTDSNHLAFDVNWITSPEVITNCLYYFEIPVNAGEYALGSVSGKAGAYLLYLDIGTGAANYDSVTIDEKIVSSSYSENFPKGIDFIADLSKTSEVKGGASASIAILAPRNKELELAISTSGTSSTITSSSSEDLQVVYKDAYTEVKGEDGKTIEGVYDSPTIVTMERKTVQTFSLTSLSLSMAYSCTWTIENAKEGEELQLYFPSDDVTWSKESGEATLSDGLVSFTADGDVSIKAEGTGSKTASEDWEGPTPIIVESTFSEFKMTVSDSSASVEYSYDELSKTYVVTIHCPVEFNVEVISLPEDSDYTITINDQEITSVGSYTFKANS